MRPDQYEQVVAEYFKNKGYEIKITPYSNDYGVDIFASNEKEKLAIQVKMFGNTSRKINRQMIMELHGAKDFFDCDYAIIATNGEILHNALEVANKLNIQILYIPAIDNNNKPKDVVLNFETIWEKYVMPLEGKILYRENGNSNKILKVDWSGIERITSNGKKQIIKIEIFKKTINYLLQFGYITRKFINEEYKDRASSGIVLILSNIGLFDKTSNPSGLKLKDDSIF